MDFKTLSASSAQTFELCEARWKAEYQQYGRGPSGAPADFGTAVHAALESWVKQRMYEQPAKEAREAMAGMWDAAYWHEFSDASLFDEGLAMCMKWLERTSFDDVEVLSTEHKTHFKLKVDGEEYRITYILDRCDRLADGSIRVVDYKTWRKPLQPGDLKHKIQPRVYALAAQLQYPDAAEIWVELDQTRFEPVSARFTRDDNVATWRYLQQLVRRIHASDGSVETLNSDCRWCVRKSECEALTRHAAVGGVLGKTDPVEVGKRRHELESARKGIDVLLGELDEFIVDYCERENLAEFDAGGVKVSIGSKPRKSIDAKMAARVIGAELASEFPGINVTAASKLLKDDRLTPEQKADLKSLIRPTYGAVKVQTEEASAL